MPQSFDRIVIHSVFGTQYRDPWIDEVIEPELHSVMAGILIGQGCKVLQIGGTCDHVHLLHTLPRVQSIAKLIGIVKSKSSAWISLYDPALYGKFCWQDGYGAFSVDWRHTKLITNYIRNQKKHHGAKSYRMTFRQEFEVFIQRYGLEGYDPKYSFPDCPTGHPRPGIVQDAPSPNPRMYAIPAALSQLTSDPGQC